MTKAYSVDLRERALAYLDEGGKKAEACRVFRIGHDTVYRWLRQREKEGHLRPKVRNQYKTRKLDRARLQRHVKAHADATLTEMADIFGVSHVAIWKALRRLNITRKKKPSVPRTQ